jgi:hypothetical protein
VQGACGLGPFSKSKLIMVICNNSFRVLYAIYAGANDMKLTGDIFVDL